VAAEILMEAGRLGVIVPGAHADLLVVDGDPLDGVRVLSRNGETLPVIMKCGVFHKKLIYRRRSLPSRCCAACGSAILLRHRQLAHPW
jgi:hypothetical protein